MPTIYDGPLPTHEEVQVVLERDGVPLPRFDAPAGPPALAATLAWLDDIAGGSIRFARMSERLLAVGELREDRGLVVYDVLDVETGRALWGGLPWDVAEAHPELAPRWQREALADGG